MVPREPYAGHRLTARGEPARSRGDDIHLVLGVRALLVNGPRAKRVRPHAQIGPAQVLDILGIAFARVGEAARRIDDLHRPQCNP